MASKRSSNLTKYSSLSNWPGFRSLRWQLVLRTLLPLGLLVMTFAIVGQIGYTQVSESLAKSRDTEVARVEADRVGDYLNDTVNVLDQFSGSPVLLTGDDQQILNSLRDEALTVRFDVVQVSDAAGIVRASSDGSSGRKVMSIESYDYLQGSGFPIYVRPGKLRDGRDAIIFAHRYLGPQGDFGGVVQAGIALGSSKLGIPLRGTRSGVYGSLPSATGSSFTYLVAGDGLVLWHPEQDKVGSYIDLPKGRQPDDDTPEAQIRNVDNEKYIIAFAPRNLNQLLTSTYVVPRWVQWYVVTQHRWADVVAPLNALLYWLVVLAFVMFLLSVVLVARSSNALTTPVAKLVSAAQALSAGKLRHRLDLLDISGPVEIEELARQFNAMAEQVQNSYADLEEKVTNRTRELATANAELARRLRESQTIQLVAAKFAGSAGLDEILNAIVISASDALETEGSAVFFPSERFPEDLEAVAVNNISGLQAGSRVPIERSLNGLTFRSGQAQISLNTQVDARVNRNVVALAGARSSLLAPLVSRGHVIGVLSTINKKWGEFSEDDVRLLTLLANQAAVAIERARLYSEARKQVETLETLNELSLSVTASRSVEDTLVGGMEHIGKLLGASGAVVFLYNEKLGSLDYTAHYNIHPDLLGMIVSSPVTIDVTDRRVASLEAFRTQEPYTVEDMTEPDYVGSWAPHLGTSPEVLYDRGINEIGVRSLVALPLTVRDKRLGALSLYFSEVLSRSFKPAEMRLFQSFANILALALYNTQLVAQTSKLATVEERARLARELHDSVTQSLFSLNLTLRAARRTLRLNVEQAEPLLDNVQELAQGALAEMRALIFELRPQALVNEGLVSALQKHADALRARSGLVVSLDIIGDRCLPIEQEEALYQIAREALHNVVKHAHAKEAWIDLDLAGDQVSLHIRDDGRGFDPSILKRDGGSHIGTSTMRERADAIGAILELKSYPGGGTDVHVRVKPAIAADSNQERGGTIETQVGRAVRA